MKQLYSSVDWDTINYGGVNTGPVDTEKARFIYQDCLEYYKEILMAITKVKQKAYILISIMFSVIAAIIGYLLSHGEGLNFSELLSLYLVIILVVLYIVAVVLMMFTVRSSQLHGGHSDHQQYFTDTYYANELRDIYIGNIRALEEKLQAGRSQLRSMSRITDISYMVVVACPLVSFVFVRLLGLF